MLRCLALVAALLVTLLSSLPAQAFSLCICLQCAGGQFRAYSAASTNMEPTFVLGKCAIAKLAGEAPAQPEPGDIIVFNPGDDQDHISRVVALAGQTVQMIDGNLWIDGKAVPTTENSDAQRLTESLPNGVKYDILQTVEDSPGDNTELFTIPPDHLFVLGDNRDNSFDSRFSDFGGFGFVAVEAVVGTVTEIRK